MSNPEARLVKKPKEKPSPAPAKPGKRIIKIVLLETLRKEFFARISLDEEHKQLLKGLMLAGTKLPPIIVTEDMEVIDGRHRIEAAVEAGFTEIEAEIRHFEDKIGKIAAAMHANNGGALPQTPADMRRCVEAMINEGATSKHIHELLPFLPQRYVAKLYDDAWTNVRARKVSAALNAIGSENLNLTQAAEKFGIDPAALKEKIQNRKKKAPQESLPHVTSGITSRIRSNSQYNRALLEKIFGAYEDGEISDKYVQEVLRALSSGTARWSRQIEDAKARFRDLQRRVKSGK